MTSTNTTDKESTNVPEARAKQSTGGAEDLALVCGKTSDGRGLHILRKRHDKLEAGVVLPVEEGKPINGELVTLKPRGQSPLCDVEVHYSPPSPTRETSHLSGPAQVATDAYRDNWDSIWKPRKKTAETDKAFLN